MRRVLGAAVVAGAAVVWLGADTGLLTRLSLTGTDRLEQGLIAGFAARRCRRRRARPKHRDFCAAVSVEFPVRDAAVAEHTAAPRRPARQGGPGEFLDLFLHQLLADAAACPRLGQKYRDRGLVVIGVHTPEFAFEKEAANVQKASAALGVSYPVVIDNDLRSGGRSTIRPGRRLFHRRRRPDPSSDARPGQLRPIRAADSATSLGNQRRARHQGYGSCPRRRFAGRGGRRRSAFIRNLHRLPAGRKFRVSRRHQAGCSQPLSRHAGTTAQPMESGRRLDGRRRVRHAQRDTRQHRLSFSRPRSSSRSGRFHSRPAGSLPGQNRWRSSGCRPWFRCRCGRAGPCGKNGSINWSGKPGKLPSAPSRSNSSIPVSAPMSSRSDRSTATANRPLL